jgi:uncharacterized protein (TIGR02391 family)
MAWTMDESDTLGLPVDALALLILSDFKQTGGWNRDSWIKDSEQHGTARDKPVARALSEGWAWLISRGLVARDPAQSSPDAYFVTRLGDEALEHGVERLLAAQRLDIELHPRIAQRVERQFLLGETELAVFAGLKDVEERVRAMGGFSDSLVGVRLMRGAFSPTKPGPLADVEADPGERLATMELFAGAIGLFKNPSSHRSVDYAAPTTAADIVLLADLLHRILDEVEHRLGGA